MGGATPLLLLYVFVAWTETALLYPVYSSLFQALFSLDIGILSFCFIRHSKVHTELRKEHVTKSLPHKSIRSTTSLNIYLFIAVVSETKGWNFRV
jgi:hypothetical protein